MYRSGKVVNRLGSSLDGILCFCRFGSQRLAELKKHTRTIEGSGFHLFCSGLDSVMKGAEGTGAVIL